MRIEREGQKLTVRLERDFNLFVKKEIKARLSPDIEQLGIDLTRSKLIDSEGVIFLHRWMAEGKHLQIINPPAILLKILEILNLDDQLDWPNIISENNLEKEVSS
jgi:ABC-type transporter Mla MlaB component